MFTPTDKQNGEMPLSKCTRRSRHCELLQLVQRRSERDPLLAERRRWRSQIPSGSEAGAGGAAAGAVL